MNRSTIPLVLFGGVFCAELVGVAFDLHDVQMMAKPLIMPFLAIYYFANIPKHSWIFVLALFFCWSGDVLLMFQDSIAYFFILGLIGFLIGHVLYIVSYRHHQTPGLGPELLTTQKFRYSLPFILAGTGLITVLFPNLGSLKAPVIVYAVVLMVMVIAALLRYGKTSPMSFWMVFAGAVLFMLSDSSLAMNKFYAPFPNSGLIIMSTYMIAQFLIIQGIIHHPTNSSRLTSNL